MRPMCRRRSLPVLGLRLLGLARALLHAAGPALVRVPQDAAGLEQAVSRVAEGGVVELAAGRYPSPDKGFNLSNLGKSFTVRAANGAQVVLDGGGARPIVRLRNSQRSRGKLITFQRIAFEH